ncbi:MAG: NAD(P)/FAD-dependent oxidoreductase [Halobacteriales archaeon]
MQVLVLGGGYAGVVLARRLERSLPEAAELTVVDESPTHLVQHELHRLVRTPGMAESITVEFEDLFFRARFVRGEVTEIDEAAGVARLADDTELSFDYAAVCLGAGTAYYDLPGVEAHSTPLKRLQDAETIRERFLELVDATEGRTVVGGAGLSGVQVAGELAELADEREVAEAVDVVLVEQADQVAPGFPDHFSDAVHEALEAVGVEVRTGMTITGATDAAVEFDTGALDYDQLVWTGGIRGTPPLDGERPTVPATLRRDDRTFVIGDAARVVDEEGNLVPATAQAAMAEARVAARNIDRLVRHDLEGQGFEPRLETVDFEASGWIVSVGAQTVAQVGPFVFRDTAARALKTAVGARYLTGVGAVRQAVGLVGDEFVAPAGAEGPAESPSD